MLAEPFPDEEVSNGFACVARSEFPRDMDLSRNQLAGDR